MGNFSAGPVVLTGMVLVSWYLALSLVPVPVQLFGSLLPGLYALLLLRDCALQLLYLQALMAAWPLHSSQMKKPPLGVTSAGLWLWQLTEAVVFQTSRVQDALFCENIGSRSPEMVDICEPPDGIERLLPVACDLFAARAAAIIDLSSGLPAVSEVSGITEQRFIAAIKRFVMLQQSNHTPLTGMYDLANDTYSMHMFSAFGIRSLVCLPLPDRTLQHTVCCFAFDTPVQFDALHCEELRCKLVRLYQSHQTHVMRREVTRARQDEQATSEFIGHLSHDIRAPLHNIKAALRLIPDGDAESELFTVALRNCDVLEQIVAGVLDYTRHTAGQLRPRPAPVWIRDLVTDVSRAFTPFASEKSIALTCSVPEGLPEILADPVHLRRVLNNLVSNALTYTEEGSVQLLVTCESNATVSVHVQDSGPGMTEQQLESMFVPFARFNSSGDGVGLGLTVSKILTEANGGTVSAASTPGAGTRISIHFPARSVTLSENSMGAEPGFPTRPHRAGSNDQLRVLLVDDDPDFLFAMERALTAHSILIITARSVTEAIAICTYEVPDFLITDDAMPGGGGATLLRALGSRLPEAQFVVLSGCEYGAAADRYPTVGPHSWMVKPVDCKDLVERIQFIAGRAGPGDLAAA